MTNDLKYSLDNARTTLVGILVCVVLLSIAACTTTHPPSQTEAPTPPPANTETAKDFLFLDGIVTPEAVFPDPTARALYEAYPPEALENKWRGYVFVLIQQPGMKTDRHFHIIAVTFAPAGELRQGLGGMTGPEIGSVDFTMRTPDGVYDLRVSEAMLLPDTVTVPEFSPKSTAERLLQRYSQHLNKQPKPLKGVYHSNAIRLEKAGLAAPFIVKIKPWQVNDARITPPATININRKL